MKTVISILIAISLMTTSFDTRAHLQALAADLIIINARVHTMDAKRPQAEAIAIYGNRIIAVGSNAEIRKLQGARTRVIDAQGRLVLPGFNDSHVHFMSGGF